jgi:hypothetical protein
VSVLAITIVSTHFTEKILKKLARNELAPIVAPQSFELGKVDDPGRDLGLDRGAGRV